MRSEVVAFAAACVAVPATAYLQPPSLAGGRVVSHGPGALSLNRAAPVSSCPFTLRIGSRRHNVAFTQMSVENNQDHNDSKAEKVREMKRLAEEAAKAVREAELAQEKASAMRRERGEKVLLVLQFALCISLCVNMQNGHMLWESL